MNTAKLNINGQEFNAAWSFAAYLRLQKLPKVEGPESVLNLLWAVLPAGSFSSPEALAEVLAMDEISGFAEVLNGLVEQDSPKKKKTPKA